MARTRIPPRTSLHLVVGLCILLFSALSRAGETPPSGRTVVFEGYIVDRVLVSSVEGLTVRAFSPERVPLKVETTDPKIGKTRIVLTLPREEPAWVVLEFSAPSYFRIARKERIPAEVIDLGRIQLTRIQTVALGRTTLSEPPNSDKIFLDTTLENLSDGRIDIEQFILATAFYKFGQYAIGKTTRVWTFPIDDTGQLESSPANNPDAVPIEVRISGQFVYEQDAPPGASDVPYTSRLDLAVHKPLDAKQIWNIRLVIPKRLTVRTDKATDKKVFMYNDFGSQLWVKLATGERVFVRVPSPEVRSDGR